MKIKEVNFAFELVGKGVEFLYGEVCLFPVCFWAKQTIEIADVGYFEIATGNHSFGTVGVSTKLMKILILTDKSPLKVLILYFQRAFEFAKMLVILVLLLCR